MRIELVENCLNFDEYIEFECLIIFETALCMRGKWAQSQVCRTITIVWYDHKRAGKHDQLDHYAGAY